MKSTLALSILSDVMGWDDATCREEFSWLQMAAKYRFDRYRGFQPGVRFLESLVGWLQQFRPEHRATAYDFVRTRVLYIGSDELAHLVGAAYPSQIRPRLIEELASTMGVASHEVWTQPNAISEYQSILRQSLFLGLSDGARIDEFRRVNEGLVSNEQVTTTVQLDEDKWIDLRDELQRDLDDPNARFRFAFLLDDFVGSGTTFLRRGEDGSVKGKLAKFWSSVEAISTDLFAADWVICVIHYVASHQASEVLPARVDELVPDLGTGMGQVECNFGLVLPEDFPLNATPHPFLDLLPEYYDPAIETRHTGPDIWLGFKQCGLPLVLEHNTPNNSIALLWAETEGKGGAHRMRPLFRRRQRHVS